MVSVYSIYVGTMIIFVSIYVGTMIVLFDFGCRFDYQFDRFFVGEIYRVWLSIHKKDGKENSPLPSSFIGYFRF